MRSTGAPEAALDGQLPDANLAAVHLRLSESQAQELRAELIRCRGTPRAAALRDALWLRTILIEQLRKTPIADRAGFGRRADRLLGHCLSTAASVPSVSPHTVAYGDKR